MGLNCHPFVYQEYAGRANPAAHWNPANDIELPEVISEVIRWSASIP
jgi:hypothetical protein